MHRSLQVVNAAADAVAAQLGGVAVFTNRTLSMSDDEQELPAVCVNMGPDQPQSETGYSNLSKVDSLLEVKLSLYAKASTQEELVIELSRIRTVTHKALLASPRDLGLTDIVMGIHYGGAEEPELGEIGSQLGGKLVCSWGIHYRMNLTDPE